MRPGDWEIVLCLDNREGDLISKIANTELVTDVRGLHTGDVLWIARRKIPNGVSEEDEIVLDALLERKRYGLCCIAYWNITNNRLDDLIRSMKDKRYDDQKVSWLP